MPAAQARCIRNAEPIMESSLIRILPVCLATPLPAGWDQSPPGYVMEVMPEVERPEVVTMAIQTTEPDILLLDADFPDIDPFTLTEQALATREGLAVVIVSGNKSPDQLRRAMLSGVEEYLIKPLEATALRDSIIGIASHRTLRVVQGVVEEVQEEDATGIVVGVVSGKGGLGKTTIAANLAAIVAKTTGKTVGLVGFESGDGTVLLNLQPRLGLMDMAGSMAEGEASYSDEWLRQFGTPHRSGLMYWTWQGSNTPGGAEIPEDFLERLFEAYRHMSTVTIIDFPLLSHDEAVSVLPLLDSIVLVSSSSDLLALRSTKSFLDMVPEDLKSKVSIVVNRSDPSDMIGREDLEQNLDQKVLEVVPNEPTIAAQAINMGSPFVLTQPQSEIAGSMRTLAQALFKLPVSEEKAKSKRRFMLF